MLQIFVSIFLAGAAAVSAVSLNAKLPSRDNHLSTTEQFPELAPLLIGNERFRQEVNGEYPGLMANLSMGQHPPYMYLGCSDSRVSEGTVFDAPPGQLFVTRNIANQYHSNDVSALSVLAYGVDALGVRHIIVMGHYGCGGVAAAITTSGPRIQGGTPGDIAISSWIEPIREIYRTSTRKEIVRMRRKNAGLQTIPTPPATDPGFRALVEENVKASVAHISQDPTLTVRKPSSDSPHKREEESNDHIYVHGWTYDIATGLINDLHVSQGPF